MHPGYPYFSRPFPGRPSKLPNPHPCVLRLGPRLLTAHHSQCSEPRKASMLSHHRSVFFRDETNRGSSEEAS